MHILTIKYVKAKEYFRIQEIIYFKIYLNILNACKHAIKD